MGTKYRLIDNIINSIMSTDVKGILLSTHTMEQLFNDFVDEFSPEYKELGISPTRDDMREYFKIPLIVERHEGQEYEVLTAV